jgi:hypothetical protein
MRWYRAVMSDNLYHQGRGFDHRRHVFTSYYRSAFTALRDSGPLAPQHAFDHPFEGVVLHVLQAAEGRADDLVEWLQTEFVPAQLARSDAAIVLAFRPAGAEVGSVPGLEGIPTPDRLVTMLWMLESDPRAHWSHWADHDALVERSGLGRVLLGAPFVPTVPGTDRYVSELR